MTQVVLFLAVFSFNAYKSLLTAPSFTEPIRLLTFFCDAVIIGWAIVRFPRNRGFFALRYLVILAIGSVFTLMLSLERVGPANHFSALREPLFFLASLVVVEDILQSAQATQFKKYFTVLLLVFCFAQIPFSYVQFREYGQGDEVGGTLGWGGPNIVTLLMFMCAFYFITVYGSSRDSDYFKMRPILVFIILLLPCAINESKISFLLIPMFFGCLMIAKDVHRLVTVAALSVTLLYLFSIIYSETKRDTDFLVSPDFLERYLLHDNREKGGIPRFQKLEMTLDLMSKEPMSFVFGMGYGTLSEKSAFSFTPFRRSVWWLTGSRAFLNTALMQGGLLLVCCLLLPMFHFLRSRNIHSSNMRRFRLFLALVLAAMWFYHDSLFNRTFAMIVAYLTLWIEDGGIDSGSEPIMSEGVVPQEATVDAGHISGGESP